LSEFETAAGRLAFGLDRRATARRFPLERGREFVAFSGERDRLRALGKSLRSQLGVST
jgi:hypothetical protein